MNFKRLFVFDTCKGFFKQDLSYGVALLCTLVGSVFFVTPLYANSLDQTQLIQQPSFFNTNEVEQLLIDVDKKRLAYNPTWLRLLHYEHTQVDTNFQSDNGSRVEDASFFVSERGKIDPQAELNAMIRDLLSTTDASKGNGSVQCRFPARTHWLQQQLNFSLPKPAVCSELTAWQNKLNPQQLAVVFAQEYPDSMTSAFAHTLLRVDSFTTSKTEISKSANYQHSHAINYTVAGDDDDSMPVYAIKSMTGKYAGMMTIDPYLPKIANYLQKEHRDVWTYPLNLNKNEVKQIIRHVWEVKDLSIPYYFLTDNCASEILRLVDVVRPSNQLYDEVSMAAIPSEVIRLLDDQQLLKQGEFVPAVNSKKQAEQNRQNDLYHGKALNNMFLPIITPEGDSDPTQGNNLQRASIVIGNQGNHNYAEFGLRASYHDLLDPSLGYLQNLHLEALSGKLRLYKEAGEVNKVQLQELVLLKGRSYHPINTARAGTSWGINAQLTQVNDASVNYEDVAVNKNLAQQHMVASIDYEKGVSFAFGKPSYETNLPPHLCYALGNGKAQVGKGLTNGFRIGAGANLGCVFKASQNLRAVTQLSVPYWYHSETGFNNRKQDYWQPTANVGVQYDFAKNHALRLMADYELSKRVANDTDLQIGYYVYF